MRPFFELMLGWRVPFFVVVASRGIAELGLVTSTLRVGMGARRRHHGAIRHISLRSALGLRHFFRSPLDTSFAPFWVGVVFFVKQEAGSASAEVPGGFPDN